MRPQTIHDRPTAGAIRARHGYDQRWWRKAASELAVKDPYWAATRRPTTSLVVVLPLLVLYEFGLHAVERAGLPAVRSGVDLWVRQGLARVGLQHSWAPPLLLIGGLAGWALHTRPTKPPRVAHVFGMLAESLALAGLLVLLSRLVDRAVWQMEQGGALLQAGAGASIQGWPRYVAFLGAGIYEEAVFRLLLIPALIVGMRVFLVPHVIAGAFAIAGSALLFSIAHHAGAPGEAFTWFAFVFRWFAGIYFAWVFVMRGFGVAVATHAAYDCIVGSMMMAN